MKRAVESVVPLAVDQGIAADYLRSRSPDVFVVLRAATTWCENLVQRQFVTATWRLSLEAFPRKGVCVSYSNIDDGLIYVPRPPLREVTSLEYIAAATGTLTTLAADLYDVDPDSDPGRIAPAYGTSWPAERSQMRAVRVTYQAGYGTTCDDIPADIQQAILMVAAHWWNNREAVALGVVSEEIALSVRDQLRPYKVKFQR